MSKVKIAVTRDEAIEILKKAIKKQELLRKYLEGKLTVKELENQGIKIGRI